MEAKITLIPLGQDEKHNHRTFAITADNPSVSVGRASKNPNKGLLAAPDNAWFDYPILSRTHADFTASLNHKLLYLTDCGSTHGTYVHKQRLNSGVSCIVTNDLVITFGQRVTSGAVTYPAKDFRVQLKWESPSDTTSMRASRPMQTTSISHPTFTNDFDYSSEPSREGSVQIVESQRHTFSVPSSDDEIDSEDEEDDVQITSSVQGGEELSAATTPDRPAVGKTYTSIEGHAKGSQTEVAPADTRGLRLKGPSLRDLLIETENHGTSQRDAINLDGVSTNIIDVDTESEDDGPEILPFCESSRFDQSNQPRVLDEPQVDCQTPAVITPKVATVAEKKADQDSKLPRHSIVPETQAKEPNVIEHQPTSVHAEPTSGATSDVYSEDDDIYDYGHDLLTDEVTDEDLEQVSKTPAIDVELSTSSKPKVTFQVGNANPHSATLTPPFDEFQPTRFGHLSASDAIDVSQSARPSSRWVQRAPSPSDAALARKVSTSKPSFSRDTLDFDFEPQWPPLPKTTHHDSMDHGFDNTALHQEPTDPYVWPELQTPEPRLYEQGPFSSQPKTVQPGPRSPKPENRRNQVRKTTVTWAEAPEDSHDFMSDDSFARTGKRASKITIPSLVENYLAENPRAIKRKHGGMSGSNDVESASKAPRPCSPMARTSGYKRTFVEANGDPLSYFVEEENLPATEPRPRADPTDCMWQLGEDINTQRQPELGDQDTPLPDAQPRENVLQSPTASASQDSVAEPALGSVAVTTTIQSHDTEGPARKKARTSSSSSSSSRGVGKFVLGVGFGLLGAAAAFVATIPASVYEEALREFSNAP